MLDILFVQNYYEQALGLMQISAVLKKHGFTTDVAVGTAKEVMSQIIEKKPKVLGFYCTTGFHHKSLALAREIKKRLGDKIIIIFGGPHPTFVPSVINEKGIDIVCRGEGEEAVRELMEALREGKDYRRIKNLIVKKGNRIYKNEIRPLVNLDTLPHPDREIYRNFSYIYKNKRQEVMLGRGCPFDCTFCSTHAFKALYKGKGTYARFRTIKRALDELVNIKNLYHPSCLFFHDDTIIMNKKYFLEFLRVYKKKINLPFACLVRADLVTDLLIRNLKKAGCYFVYFGIESGNEDLRNSLLRKNLEDKDILNCAKILHQYKISFSTTNIVGLPDETLDKVWDTIDINMKAKPAWAWFSVYQALPETELAQYSLKKGYLKSIDVAESDANFHESGLILQKNPQAQKIMRLKNLGNLMIKMPFLKMPVKMIFLNLPLDAFYGTMDKLLYFIFHYSKLTYKMSFLETVYSALFLARHSGEFK